MRVVLRCMFNFPLGLTVTTWQKWIVDSHCLIADGWHRRSVHCLAPQAKDERLAPQFVPISTIGRGNQNPLFLPSLSL